MVSVDRVRYSVPVTYAFRRCAPRELRGAATKSFDPLLELGRRATRAATCAARSVLELAHYLDAFARKPRAALSAAALQGRRSGLLACPRPGARQAERPPPVGPGCPPRSAASSGLERLAASAPRGAFSRAVCRAPGARAPDGPERRPQGAGAGGGAQDARVLRPRPTSPATRDELLVCARERRCERRRRYRSAGQALRHASSRCPGSQPPPSRRSSRDDGQAGQRPPRVAGGLPRRRGRVAAPSIGSASRIKAARFPALKSLLETFDFALRAALEAGARAGRGGAFTRPPSQNVRPARALGDGQDNVASAIGLAATVYAGAGAGSSSAWWSSAQELLAAADEHRLPRYLKGWRSRTS